MTDIASSPLWSASLAALTCGPHGLFSRTQAADRGLTDEDLRRLVRAGALVRVTYGWYAPRDPGLDRWQQHRRHAHALRRRMPDAVLSHHSALLAHDLPAFGADLATVHLTHRYDTSPRRRAGCVLHRADHTVHALAPDAETVSLADAVVQVGRGNPLSTLVAADQAVRTGAVTPAELAAAAERWRGRRGYRQAVAILGEVDPSAESPAESLARHALRALGHEVRPQLPVVVDGRHYRVDLAVGRLAIEVDGMSKYLPSGRDPGDPRTPAEVLRAEKAREAAIVRSGRPVLRLTWGEIVTPGGRVRYDNVSRLVEAMLSAFPTGAHLR